MAERIALHQGREYGCERRRQARTRPRERELVRPVEEPPHAARRGEFEDREVVLPRVEEIYVVRESEARTVEALAIKKRAQRHAVPAAQRQALA